MAETKELSRVLIKDLKEHIGEDVLINGWVDKVRDHGKVAFIVPRDRSGSVQAVASNDYNDTALPEAQKLHEQWVVELVGEVKQRPDKMKKDELNGELELGIKEVRVLSEAAELPFDMDAELNLDTLLDNRPLTIRTQRGRDIFKVASTIVQEYRNVLIENDFTEFQAPALTGGDAEGGAEVFKVEYFNDKQAYLATSPQLYKEIMTGAFERVFTIAKIFRAEKSATTRHLSEITQMDFEMGFIKDHKDVMAMLEKVTRSVSERVASEHSDILERLGTKPAALPDGAYPSFTLRETQDILKEEYGIDAIGEQDMEPEHERKICEYALEKFGSDFVFITEFPTAKRAFYTYPDPENPEWSYSFDLLFRGLEINSGGQRLHNYDQMVEIIKGRGMDPETFEFYLQMHKYGIPPHGGSSTGLERFVGRMLELSNVKEAVPFPRDINRIDTLLSKESEQVIT